MGGNRQKKSSSSSGFFSMFNIFSSKKHCKAGYHDSCDHGKVWPSDYDKGNWGVADPAINIKADAFIRKYKQRASESSCYQVDPHSEDA